MITTTTMSTTFFQSVLDDWALFYHREEGLSVIIPLKCEPASDRKRDSAGALQEQRTRERGVASLSVVGRAVEELTTTQQEDKVLQEARKQLQEVTIP
jgi:hypothetical protein